MHGNNADSSRRCQFRTSQKSGHRTLKPQANTNREIRRGDTSIQQAKGVRTSKREIPNGLELQHLLLVERSLLCENQVWKHVAKRFSSVLVQMKVRLFYDMDPISQLGFLTAFKMA